MSVMDGCSLSLRAMRRDISLMRFVDARQTYARRQRDEHVAALCNCDKTSPIAAVSVRHRGNYTWSRTSRGTLHYCVLGSLSRPSPDDLPSRLRFKYCWLFCERIDTAALFCCGLLDDNEFCKSGHKKSSCFVELLLVDRRERLDDGFDVLSRHIVRMLLSDFLNEFRFRHQFLHCLLQNFKSYMVSY